MTEGDKERIQAGIEGEWVCVGALGAPHGVRGDVRLRPFTENPAAIFKFNDLRLGANGKSIVLVKKGKSKDGFIVHIDGLNSPEEANALKIKDIYVLRSEFDQPAEDEFFLADLIGLTAIDLSGTDLGVVTTVDNFGSEDLLEVVLHEPVKSLGRTIFIPFRKTLVPNISLADGTATIDFLAWQETQTSERDDVEGEVSESKGQN
jgi:16S rRNA processing protein RimM